MTSISIRVCNTGHFMDFCKLETNKKYKEQKLKEIIPAICALLNTNGGNFVLYNECKCGIAEHFSFVVRILEQSMISIIGVNQTVSNISFQEREQCLDISVKKVDNLITTNYHLYLPSETQVVQVSPLESLKYVTYIINNKDVSERLEHVRIFFKFRKINMRESKTCNFKNLKADQSKCTTLADRITGNSNKFSHYVSAFANYRGRHIYYGIRDDKIVEGEVVPNEEDKHDITRKVEKTINKMIWPEKIGQPKRGEHWEIFFEPVIDEATSDAIPSTFVIVIYIASCPGGVFTKEPECYEMVEGKVKMMSFMNWKKKISEPALLGCSLDDVPRQPSTSSIKWSSVEARKAFTNTHEELMPFINNGNWKAISGEDNESQGKSGIYSLRLPVLSKLITAGFRRGHLDKAGKLLDIYKQKATEGEDSSIFQLIGLYLEGALKRARGDKTDALKEILTDALSQTERFEPGVVTATVYVFVAGTVLNDPKNLDYSLAAVLSARALEHLQHESDSPKMVNNLKKKAYLILTAFHLGCSISGERFKENVDRSSLVQARSIIMRMNETVLEGNPLSKYHKIQFNLVQSIYHYRHSQINPEKRNSLLKDAFNCAKETECLAKENQFPEMVEWSRANKALFTEELLVRTKLG